MKYTPTNVYRDPITGAISYVFEGGLSIPLKSPSSSADALRFVKDENKSDVLGQISGNRTSGVGTTVEILASGTFTAPQALIQLYSPDNDVSGSAVRLRAYGGTGSVGIVTVNAGSNEKTVIDGNNGSNFVQNPTANRTELHGPYTYVGTSVAGVTLGTFGVALPAALNGVPASDIDVYATMRSDLSGIVNPQCFTWCVRVITGQVVFDVRNSQMSAATPGWKYWLMRRT